MSPPRPVLLFDGVCKLCTGSVAFVLRHEGDQDLRFAPLQSPAGVRLMQEFSIDPNQMKTFVVIADGKAYVRSDAAIRVARFLRGAWKLLSMLKIIPRPMRDYAYDVVARNRYRWFGRHDACIVPTPELRKRFIDE
ncbi:MAG TPA: thiol-disulfide oxidoreductase DCC family protein [Steroidobacteraceae bacterium]|nr:thiol-disulfide oxidoreductase DCC family protein [Steroidobacteraceae bacterium]